MTLTHEDQVLRNANRRLVVQTVILHVVFPVAVGAAIYTLWRSKRLLVFDWYRWAGWQTAVSVVRADAFGLRHLIPGPVLYSLPDALWVYSFTAFMTLLWSKQRKTFARTFWLLLPTTMAASCEIGQFLKIVPGTFDIVDLLSYFVAGVLAWILVNSAIRGKYEYS